MTEIEVPIEKVQEDINHAAHHASGETQKLMNQGAVLSAILAVFAAVAALFAGHYANEAMISQIQSSDQWAFFQAKGIKAAITEMRAEMNKDSSLTEKYEGYKKEQEQIKEIASEKQHESEHLLKKHETLATSVTFFQVAIALTAIAVLARKRRFLVTACALGSIGLFFVIKGFIF